MKLRVNGLEYEVHPPPERLLVDLLREDLHLTGTKRGCEDGSCGACTVLVDREPRHACLTLAHMVEGRDVTTIEGASSSFGLSSLQRALIENGGLQCGFCAPGMVLAVEACLLRGKPTREEIREAIAGNYCRCTGYAKIVDAAEKVVRERWGP